MRAQSSAPRGPHGWSWQVCATTRSTSGDLAPTIAEPGGVPNGTLDLDSPHGNVEAPGQVGRGLGALIGALTALPDVEGGAAWRKKRPTDPVYALPEGVTRKVVSCASGTAERRCMMPVAAKEVGTGATQIIESVQEAETKVLGTLRRFVDTVDGTLPALVNGRPRTKVIHAAFTMTEELVGAANSLAEHLVLITGEPSARRPVAPHRERVLESKS